MAFQTRQGELVPVRNTGPAGPRLQDSKPDQAQKEQGQVRHVVSILLTQAQKGWTEIADGGSWAKNSLLPHSVCPHGVYKTEVIAKS